MDELAEYRAKHRQAYLARKRAELQSRHLADAPSSSSSDKPFSRPTPSASAAFPTSTSTTTTTTNNTVPTTSYTTVGGAGPSRLGALAKGAVVGGRPSSGGQHHHQAPPPQVQQHQAPEASSNRIFTAGAALHKVNDEALSRQLQVAEDERLAKQLEAQERQQMMQQPEVRPPDTQFAEQLIDNTPTSIFPPPPNVASVAGQFGTYTRPSLIRPYGSPPPSANLSYNQTFRPQMAPSHVGARSSATGQTAPTSHIAASGHATAGGGPSLVRRPVSSNGYVSPSRPRSSPNSDNIQTPTPIPSDEDEEYQRALEASLAEHYNPYPAAGGGPRRY